jgi:hypothetical protein
MEVDLCFTVAFFSLIRAEQWILRLENHEQCSDLTRQNGDNILNDDAGPDPTWLAYKKAGLFLINC